MTYTIRFGNRSAKTDDRYTAFVIAEALKVKGWLGVRIVDQNGEEVK